MVHENYKSYIFLKGYSLKHRLAAHVLLSLCEGSRNTNSYTSGIVLIYTRIFIVYRYSIKEIEPSVHIPSSFELGGRCL